MVDFEAAQRGLVSGGPVVGGILICHEPILLMISGKVRPNSVSHAYEPRQSWKTGNISGSAGQNQCEDPGKTDEHWGPGYSSDLTLRGGEFLVGSNSKSR